MNFKRRTIVFEAADIEAESAFWAGLLDGTVEQKETWSVAALGEALAANFPH